MNTCLPDEHKKYMIVYKIIYDKIYTKKNQDPVDKVFGI